MRWVYFQMLRDSDELFSIYVDDFFDFNSQKLDLKYFSCNISLVENNLHLTIFAENQINSTDLDTS